MPATTGYNAACPNKAPSAAAFRKITRTSASAPNVPIRLSRMIVILLSRSRPPPNPSQVSASPSSCRAPVNRIAVVIAARPAARSGIPKTRAMTATAAATAPMIRPTNGKHQATRMSGRSSSWPVTIGNRVRKAIDSRSSHRHMRHLVSWVSGILLTRAFPAGHSGV